MFEYKVVDLLPIGKRSIVFTGKIGQGEVHVGDSLILSSPQGELAVTVTSLEPSGFRSSCAMAGDNVAIVIACQDLDTVADGFRHVEGNTYQVKSLTLHAKLSVE